MEFDHYTLFCLDRVRWVILLAEGFLASVPDREPLGKFGAAVLVIGIFGFGPCPTAPWRFCVLGALLVEGVLALVLDRQPLNGFVR